MVLGEDDGLAQLLPVVDFQAVFYEKIEGLADGILVEQPLVEGGGLDPLGQLPVLAGEGGLTFRFLFPAYQSLCGKRVHYGLPCSFSGGILMPLRRLILRPFALYIIDTRGYSSCNQYLSPLGLFPAANPPYLHPEPSLFCNGSALRGGGSRPFCRGGGFTILRAAPPQLVREARGPVSLCSYQLYAEFLAERLSQLLSPENFRRLYRMPGRDARRQYRGAPTSRATLYWAPIWRPVCWATAT